MLIFLLSVIAADIVPIEEWDVPAEGTVMADVTVATDVSPKIIRPTMTTTMTTVATVTTVATENCACPKTKKIGKIMSRDAQAYLF